MKKMYFSIFEDQYVKKNKLHRDVAALLKSYNRDLVTAAKLESYKQEIITNIGHLNRVHKTCKPMDVSWWQPGIGEIEKDWHLSGIQSIVGSFIIYESK